MFNELHDRHRVSKTVTQSLRHYRNPLEKHKSFNYDVTLFQHQRSNVSVAKYPLPYESQLHLSEDRLTLKTKEESDYRAGVGRLQSNIIDVARRQQR